MFANLYREDHYHANFIPNLRCRINTHFLPGSVIFEEGNQYFQRSRDCSPHDFIVPSVFNHDYCVDAFTFPLLSFLDIIYLNKRKEKTRNKNSFYLYMHF